MKKGLNKKIILTLGITLIFLMPSSMLTVGSNVIKADDNNLISFSYSNNKLSVSLDVQEILQDQITTEYGMFTIFDLPSVGFIGNLGKPRLPVITSLIAVPTLDVSLNIIQSNIAESILVGKIYPAQKPQTDSESAEVEFIIDEEFYQQDIEYPGELVAIATDGNIRDISFIKLEFYPIQYNPKQEIATIYDEITIELTWNPIESVSVESDFSHSSFSKFYENTFSNWQGFLENTQIEESVQGSGKGAREEGCDYIIITHPDYYSEIEALAEWKHTTGVITKVVSTTETGSTSNAIKQYLQAAYDDWSPRPSYLLLVGDSEDIPTSSSGTDLYYVTVDGSDYFPDMFHGRIPVDTPQEAAIIFDKILNYEQNPPSYSSFYNNFAVAAYFQDDENNGYETRRFVRTSEEIRDYLMTKYFIGERIYVTESYVNPTYYNNGYYGNGEPLPADLLRPTFAWDGDANDIINAIESGIFILNHRDHGFENGWGDPYFDTGHVDGLTNGNLLPVVFSINCLTGRFDGMECFAEEFLRKDGGGAVAVFAATRVSYSGYNDYLCRGFYDAQWPDFDTAVGTDDPMYTLGELLNYGKVYMGQTWGDPWGYEDYTFELFHVFGDPTMEIWTKAPQSLDVTYEISPGILEVTVKKGSSPVKGALVCALQDNGFYVKGVSDSSGVATLDVINPSSEEVTLTVTAHNYKYNQQHFFLNRAPEPPAKALGEIRPDLSVSYDYETFTTDAEGEDISYWFDWGDNTSSGWTGPFPSGDMAVASHAWSTRGPFIIKVKAKDINDQESEWSEPLEIMVSNTIPPIPVLTGQQNFVMPHKTYEYKVKITEPDDDDIWVWVSWSDGGATGWKGPFSSGYTFKTSHVWMEYGQTYIVSAKTKDIFDEESDWAELEIHTMKSRAINLDIIDLLLQRFPLIQQLFERLFYL